jgi:hypothetical protein
LELAQVVGRKPEFVGTRVAEKGSGHTCGVVDQEIQQIQRHRLDGQTGSVRRRGFLGSTHADDHGGTGGQERFCPLETE